MLVVEAATHQEAVGRTGQVYIPKAAHHIQGDHHRIQEDHRQIQEGHHRIRHNQTEVAGILPVKAAGSYCSLYTQDERVAEVRPILASAQADSMVFLEKGAEAEAGIPSSPKKSLTGVVVMLREER